MEFNAQSMHSSVIQVVVAELDATRLLMCQTLQITVEESHEQNLSLSDLATRIKKLVEVRL